MAVTFTDLVQTVVVLLSFEALKCCLLAFRTGGLRGKHKTFVTKEDQVTLGKGEGAVGADHPEVVRWNSAHRNELENLLPFLCVVVAFVYMASVASKGDSSRDPTAGIILFTVWVGSRMIHTICYVNEIQPARTAAWVFGVLTLFATGFYAIINVFVNTP